MAASFQDVDLEREYQSALAGAYGPVKQSMRQMQGWDMPRLQQMHDNLGTLQKGNPLYSSSRWKREALGIMMDLRSRDDAFLAIPPTQAINLGTVGSPQVNDPFESFSAYSRGPQQQQPQMGSAYFGIGGLTGRQPQQQGGSMMGVNYGAQLAPMMNQAYRKVTVTIGLGSQSGSQYTR